jgi:hypothetical protein
MSKQPTPEVYEIKEFDQTIGLAYQKLLALARIEWERRFAGKDPSDACASVRIRPAGRKKGFDSHSEFPGVNVHQVVHPGAGLPFANRRAKQA